MASNSRRRARVAAMKALYAQEVGKQEDSSCSDSIQEANLTEEAAQFAQALYDGVTSHREAIAATIDEKSHGFAVKRMAAVDRCILYIGVYEISYSKETPRPVVINEAVEIAKEFSTAESGAFVNGILGALNMEESPSG